MECKISIIIPVYNVEKYIERCLESILNQAFNEYEVIIVNDGSTDNSGKICDKYSEINKNINVIHKKNGGVSSARNLGIDVAKGEYIARMDDDDISRKETLDRELSPLFSIKDAYPKVLLARTKHPDSQVEGVKIIDIARWLSNVSQF